MIYNRQFKHAHAAMMKCDRCGRELLSQATRMTMFTSGLDLAPKQEPTIEQRRKLRRIAQDFGWIYVLVSVLGPANQDLCPDCFVLPPEAE